MFGICSFVGVAFAWLVAFCGVWLAFGLVLLWLTLWVWAGFSGVVDVFV